MLEAMLVLLLLVLFWPFWLWLATLLLYASIVGIVLLCAFVLWLAYPELAGLLFLLALSIFAYDRWLARRARRRIGLPS